MVRDKLGGNTSKLIIHRSDKFKSHGADFNKAAALCEGISVTNSKDWILHFDSDIIPPAHWREVAESTIEPGNLYGSFRWDEQGRFLDEHPLYPYGYFHLWHRTDPSSWQWPIFEVWHRHAGNYDSHFAEQWHWNRRKDLQLHLIHQGEPRRNWFGDGGEEKMKQTLDYGLTALRIESSRGMHKLEIPEPKLKLCIQRANPDWVADALHACSLAGPFYLEAIVSYHPRHGYQFIDGDTSIQSLTELVLSATKPVPLLS
jgi:hypothetical protein